MPNYQFKCRDCKSEFNKFIEIGREQAFYHGHGDVTYIINDKLMTKEEYKEYNDKLMAAVCPVCMSQDTFKMIFPVAVVYDDNLTPGTGWATVDKRHADGLDWDNPHGKAEADRINREMREEGKREAIKMAKKDEERIRSSYRQVSQAEAEAVLRSKDRSQEVVVIDESATNT